MTEPPARPLLLLVDDDPVVRLTLARALTGWGYDVCTAADGRAAMSYWRRSEAARSSTRKGRASGRQLTVRVVGFHDRGIVAESDGSYVGGKRVTRGPLAVAAPQTKLLERCGCAISQPVPTEHNQRLEGVS